MPRNYTRKTTWGQTPLAEMESAAAEVRGGASAGWLVTRMKSASNGGGNELLVTVTGSCSSGCVEQIWTGHKSYKAQLSPPLLLFRFAARASQEGLSAERADSSLAPCSTVARSDASRPGFHMQYCCKYVHKQPFQKGLQL
ncbi:unnamed protein product [Pleuronectes platessa]|uniref:Uncharacterized protein n=1 Tax=Pleuronectes platessa TaxID=8262 RepID=A0A9N7UHL7_PLEPL|nr:unnamed protein product [Pleuronectes platessa]